MEPADTIFHFLGSMCFMVACAFAFIMLRVPEAYHRFCGLAGGSREFYPEHALLMLTYEPPSWYIPSRLWRTAALVVGFAGATYGCYGLLVQLLFWMPRDWRTEDGVWMALRLATASCWLLALGVVVLLHRVWQQLLDAAEAKNAVVVGNPPLSPLAAASERITRRMREAGLEVTEAPPADTGRQTATFVPARKHPLSKEQLEAQVATAQEARRKNPPLKEIELYRSLGFEVVEHPVGSGYWFKKNGGYMESIN